jgi:hypothetical protein
MMKTICLHSLLWLVVFGVGVTDCATGKQATESTAVIFRAVPTKRLFKPGEDIVLVLSIQNNSTDPVFVSRLAGDEFVDLKLTGPDGKEVPWQGKRIIDSKSYSPSDFVVLKRGERVSARRTISAKDGHGFVIERSGRYSATAQYSLEPPEYFAPLAGKAKIPPGSLVSRLAIFCFTTCDSDSRK